MLHTWESLGQVANRDEYWFDPILRKHQARVPDTREETITEANLWGSVPTCVVCVKIDLSQAVGVSWSN